MTRVYLGLGSNLRSAERQLRQAITALRQLPQTQLCQIASFYRNKAWGRKAQPQFYNTVLAINTKLSPQRLLKLCLKIEEKQGRIRKVKWGARTLDIDILLYGSQCIDTRQLKIPHPRMHERDFVCVPLLEVDPQIKLPNGKKIIF